MVAPETDRAVGHDFEVGSVVCIASQPKTILAPIAGLRGVVSETMFSGQNDNEPLYDVTTINEHGIIQGGGWIRQRHLEPEKDSKWLQAAAEYESRIKGMERNLRVQTQHWMALVGELATRYKLTKRDIETIYAELRNFTRDIEP